MHGLLNVHGERGKRLISNQFGLSLAASLIMLLTGEVGVYRLGFQGGNALFFKGWVGLISGQLGLHTA